MAKKNLKKKDSRISIKKKRWYNVMAPKVLNNVLVCETPAADPKLLESRVISVNLASVMRTMKRQNVQVKFKVLEIKGNECVTEFVSYEILPVFIKRLVKKGRCRIDDSFVVNTKDSKKVRLKPLILTRNLAQKGVLSAIRKEAQVLLTKKLSKMDYSEFVSKVLINDVQKELKSNLKKIYPVAIVEMRALKLVSK
jgi:small subunit ribosomal protein S3Ae